VPQPTPDRPGLFTHALDLLGAGVAYLQARLALVSLEGREAAGHYFKTLALLLGGVVVVVFGYFFFWLAVIFAIASAFGGGAAWIWVTLGAALLHFALGAGLIFKVRSLVQQPVFEATLEEFKKDQSWLETKTGKQS